MSARTDFQSRLLNRWAKIKPLAKDVVVDPNEDPKDIYFEGDLADVLAQGIATALYEDAPYCIVAEQVRDPRHSMSKVPPICPRPDCELPLR